MTPEQIEERFWGLADDLGHVTVAATRSHGMWRATIWNNAACLTHMRQGPTRHAAMLAAMQAAGVEGDHA